MYRNLTLFILLFCVYTPAISQGIQNNTQLIVGSWTLDIEAMLENIPTEQKSSQKQLLNSMQVIYVFTSDGIMEAQIMGKDMADGAFWQFSEDEKVLYLVSSAGTTEELNILELNRQHLVLKDSKGKKLFFVPYKK